MPKEVGPDLRSVCGETGVCGVLLAHQLRTALPGTKKAFFMATQYNTSLSVDDGPIDNQHQRGAAWYHWPTLPFWRFDRQGITWTLANSSASETGDNEQSESLDIPVPDPIQWLNDSQFGWPCYAARQPWSPGRLVSKNDFLESSVGDCPWPRTDPLDIAFNPAMLHWTCILCVIFNILIKIPRRCWRWKLGMASMEVG